MPGSEARRPRHGGNLIRAGADCLVRLQQALVAIAQSTFVARTQPARRASANILAAAGTKLLAWTSSAVMLAILVAAAGCVRESPKTDVRLVLAITVDQLRGDVLAQYEKRFESEPDSGFGYLLRTGVVFEDANFDHATTFTAVGHATLFTGSQASVHGVTGNAWLEGTDVVWCVDDSASPILDDVAGSGATGSPKNLMVETVGDALVGSNAEARVFSVSTKERSAILSGGHRGKSFWYDKRSGRYVTSRFYYDESPAWLNQWNDKGKVWQYRTQSWELSEDPANYLYADEDDAPWESANNHLGRVFPHPLNRDDDGEFLSAIRYTPMADELTFDVARDLVQAEQIGKGDHIDLLALGLSATDYVGHAFGPSSLEAEDNLFRLDEALGRFFRFIDAEVGLAHTVIVLVSDHGIPEIPERFIAKGEDSGRIDIEAMMALVRAELTDRYDPPRDLLVGFSNPALFLDREAMADLGLNPAEVQATVARIAAARPGIAHAVTRAELAAGKGPDEQLTLMMGNAFYPSRSGDVILVQKPNWYLHLIPYGLATMHGSPYRYDTHIPMVFAVPGLAPQRVSRPVRAVDMAPTLARILDIDLIDRPDGKPLSEVVAPR
jgi:predicted AlkP superfamily pyrophosphatase or phosphodiesterase